MGGCKGQQGRSKGLKVGATCNLLRALPSWRLWQPPWACGLLALFIWSGLGFWHMGPFAHNKIQEHVMLSCCIEMLIALGRAFPSLRKVSQGRADSKLSNSTPLKGYTIGRAHPKGPTLHVHLSRHSRIFNTEHGQLQQAFWSFERKLINQDYCTK